MCHKYLPVLLLLTACSNPNSDLNAGPVVLRCHGQQTVVGPRDLANERTEYYRIDRQQSKLETWDINKRHFVSAGVGEFVIRRTEIVFVSATAGNVRNVKFDLRDWKVVDTEIPLVGTMKFTGNCRPAHPPRDWL